MEQAIKVGVIGDFSPDNHTHIATNEAIYHTAENLAISVDACWLPTRSLENHTNSSLEKFDAFWCSPGSPYQSMAGALLAIQFAREQDYPFIGT